MKSKINSRFIYREILNRMNLGMIMISRVKEGYHYRYNITVQPQKRIVNVPSKGNTSKKYSLPKSFPQEYLDMLGSPDSEIRKMSNTIIKSFLTKQLKDE